ncbi:hypothetical protein DCE93_13740 [Agromyces badenianii]|uniref:Uncharacterized protein n=1 Tax=Agromyces badenianii TaxID=2080742 RepID=A0A2S0WZ23_9MICO|nr:hypothetical protein [Agromyces badenianii]AWB96576.1 hypothetical protein DCE93_13740 [Agromyces badenianii]
MRKTILLSGAVAVLFIGSIFVGIAAATTGAPVLYDARSPQPVAKSSGEFGVEAGPATGRDSHVPADGADSNDDAPLPASPTPPSTAPAPTPAPTPSPATPPADPVPTAEEQQAWLGFQQLVRECMTGAGHEYRYWEWWNTEPRDPTSTDPAMPDGFTPEGEAAWRLALEGTGGDDDGCLGEAVRADQQRPAEPPASATPAPGAPDSEGVAPDESPEG